MNRLQLKILLMDTALYLRHGDHLVPNYFALKKEYTKLVGISERCAAKTLLLHLMLTYHENNLWEEAENFCKSIGLTEDQYVPVVNGISIK